MKSLEKKLFEKLAKKGWFTVAKIVCRFQLFSKKHLSEKQFDQYLTTLGPREVTLKLKNKTERQKRKLTSFNQDNLRKPTKKLKIAILLSGQPRSLENCIDSLQRFFYGHDVSYFCHSWQGQVLPKQLALLGKYQLVETESPDFSEYEYEAIKTFGIKKFGDGTKVPYVSPNVFPMWFGVQKAFQSIEEHNQKADDFDLICRMRYDNFWIGQFDCEDKILAENEVMIDHNYNGYGGYGDQFAIGKPQAMKIYCNLYDWLVTEFLKGESSERCFPEVMLKDYMTFSGLKVIQENFGLRLLRPEFVGLSAHKIPLRSHKASSERNANMAKYLAEKYPEFV
ncbi:hypothetical protein MGWOODY_Tha1541 [hydrothermal vent metagenome]|uniref:Uncharacterized protein n=1 Tax=hydrothermal vent metagenome TaxID=652676 RepID=A0A161JZY2_9ZZZZ